MEVLSKDNIRTWILPSLPFSTPGRPSAVEPTEFVEDIYTSLIPAASGGFYRLTSSLLGPF